MAGTTERHALKRPLLRFSNRVEIPGAGGAAPGGSTLAAQIRDLPPRVYSYCVGICIDRWYGARTIHQPKGHRSPALPARNRTQFVDVTFESHWVVLPEVSRLDAQLTHGRKRREA